MTSLALSLLISLSLSGDKTSIESTGKAQVSEQVLRLSEPLVQDEKTETFGAVMSNSSPKLQLKTLASNPQNYLKSAFQVDTKIAKVCQKKGCFFIAQDGDTVMRVSFKDYAFFIPTDTAGRIVRLEGELVEKELSQEQAAHYRSDLGSDSALSASIQAGKVYEIVASSVRIPKAL
ncbi:DUF4920 domain-containing protein [Glaciecola sp. MH2013]|nr:DUF4920 domain-containing protein [Glaciecola sp. MH2013]